jgi:LemA protein
MTMHSRLILERIYRLPEPRPGFIRRIFRRTSRKFWTSVREHTTRLSVGATVVSVWILGHIYYYNRLYDLEANVLTARAQIRAAEQRRGHVGKNLTQLVRFYAKYESNLMKELTDRRANKPATDATTMQSMLASLNAVAEQYPNLNLTKTVEQFSQSVIATETEIAQRIMAYNDAVNIYTTMLGQFPANIFGRPLGFRSYNFYQPPDPTELDFREVQP